MTSMIKLCHDIDLGKGVKAFLNPVPFQKNSREWSQEHSGLNHHEMEDLWNHQDFSSQK